jgi:hypothetical protein
MAESEAVQGATGQIVDAKSRNTRKVAGGNSISKRNQPGRPGAGNPFKTESLRLLLHTMPPLFFPDPIGSFLFAEDTASIGTLDGSPKKEFLKRQGRWLGLVYWRQD